MTLAAYLFGLFLVSVFFWIAWGMTLFSVNPYDADRFSFASFFISLFFALMATFTLLGFWIRGKTDKKGAVTSHVGVSLRHAFLLSAAGIGLLLLQAARVLSWWAGGLLVGSILLLELYFRTR